jgi:HK97 family phage portal protein
MKNDVVLYNAAGEPMETKSTVPDLDPTFFHSMVGAASGNVEKIRREPYAWHSWVYACASRRSRTLAGLKAILHKEDDPNKVITQHPVLDLLSRPNIMMSRAEFIEAVQLALLLPTPDGPGGQCFILPADDNGDPVDIVRGVMPTSLYPYNDVMVKPVVDGHIFKGWEFKHPSGQDIFYHNDQVIRIRFFNPYNPLLGQSPFAALRPSIINDSKGMELSDKFFDNNAMLGSILSTDKTLLKEQFNQIKKQWAEQHEGWRNAGKTALLHGGLELTQASHNLQDLAFTEQQNISKEKVIAVYGVPKILLGLTDSVNRATAQVEIETFWEYIMSPDMDRYWDGLNEQFIRYMDKRDLIGSFDVSRVEGLKRNQEAKINNADKLIMRGMPPNTAWATVGLDTQTSNMPWLDEPFVKGPLVNMDSGEVIGAPSPKMTPEAEGKELKNKIYVIKDNKEQTWLSYIAKVLDPTERRYKKDYIKFLNGQRNRFNDQVDEWVRENKNVAEMIQKAAAGAQLSDFMIPKKEEDKLIIAMADPIQQDVIERQAAEMAVTLGDLTQFDTEGARAQAIIKARHKWLKNINTQTFKTMGDQITKILKDNPTATINELAKKIKEAQRKTTNAIIASSANTVARTETSSVASGSRYEIMKSEDVEKHQWISARDGNERHTHMAEDAHGQAIEIGKRFPVTKLLFPLDSTGAAKETINCRCTTVIAE